MRSFSAAVIPEKSAPAVNASGMPSFASGAFSTALKATWNLGSARATGVGRNPDVMRASAGWSSRRAIAAAPRPSGSTTSSENGEER